MEEDLISKKDLLLDCDISYGQLYRWRRKGLIPEDWFIRRSTFTGQETFFPRDKVLARVEKIKSMKGDISLDDLADVFSPGMDCLNLSGDEITNRGIAAEEVLAAYEKRMGAHATYSFHEILLIRVLGMLFETGSLSTDECMTALNTLSTGMGKYADEQCALHVVRRLGVSISFLTPSGCIYIFAAEQSRLPVYPFRQ